VANQRFTLRITPSTDVALATKKLQQALADQGVINPSLTELIADTAHRFQKQLTAAATINNNGHNSEHNSPATPTRNAADTLIRGDGYSIRITTQAANVWSNLADRLLRRPAAFS